MKKEDLKVGMEIINTFGFQSNRIINYIGPGVYVYTFVKNKQEEYISLFEELYQWGPVVEKEIWYKYIYSTKRKGKPVYYLRETEFTKLSFEEYIEDNLSEGPKYRLIKTTKLEVEK